MSDVPLNRSWDPSLIPIEDRKFFLHKSKQEFKLNIRSTERETSNSRWIMFCILMSVLGTLEKDVWITLKLPSDLQKNDDIVLV